MVRVEGPVYGALNTLYLTQYVGLALWSVLLIYSIYVVHGKWKHARARRLILFQIGFAAFALGGHFVAAALYSKDFEHEREMCSRLSRLCKYSC